MDKDEYFNFFKIVFIGIIVGIAINFIIGIFNSSYEGESNHLSIFFKCLLVDGILFSTLVFVGLYFVLDFFVDMSINLDWKMTVIFTLAYLGGIYSVTSFIETFAKNSPQTPIV